MKHFEAKINPFRLIRSEGMLALADQAFALPRDAQIPRLTIIPETKHFFQAPFYIDLLHHIE